MQQKKQNCNNLKIKMGIEILVNYIYRRSLRFGPKMGFLFYVTSERVVVKNFIATQKMQNNVQNALQKTDLKNIEK